MEREGFIFYVSFADAIDTLPDDQQLTLYKAIQNYGLHGTIPDIEGPALGMFRLIKPQIDANNRRYKNGQKGGKPKQTDGKPSDNQDGTKGEPKEKENVNENDNDKQKDDQPSLEFSFEAFKAKYPIAKDGNKPGMTRAQKVYSQSVNGQRSEVFKALENYAKSEQVEKGIVMSAEKFLLTDWRDWMDIKSDRNGKPPKISIRV